MAGEITRRRFPGPREHATRDRTRSLPVSRNAARRYLHNWAISRPRIPGVGDMPVIKYNKILYKHAWR